MARSSEPGFCLARLRFPAIAFRRLSMYCIDDAL